MQNADLAAFHREASAAARYGDATNFVLTDLHVIAGQLAALSADAALYAVKQGGRNRVGGAV